MEIRSNGGADFRELAARLRKAGAQGKSLRSALTKKLRQEAAPLVDDLKANVRAVQSKGVAGRGEQRRTQFANRKAKRPRAKPHGLRATVARSIRSRVQYSGKTYGLRVFVDATSLPQSQRRLPAYLNRPQGWRHPVWGHRDRWVQQTGEPWWDRAIVRHKPRLRRAVTAAVNATLKQLQ